VTSANFNARLVDRNGRTVPGSVRNGHNVFTNLGRAVLGQLFSWGSIGVTDVPNTSRRIRWTGVGVGTQPETTAVAALNAPALLTLGGNYIKTIDTSRTTFPNLSSVGYVLVFDPAELSFAGDVVITEAALYADVSPGSVLTPSAVDNEPMFYKTFEGLVKTPAFSLEITWELRF
jgi:hypothetical protein